MASTLRCDIADDDLEPRRPIWRDRQTQATDALDGDWGPLSAEVMQLAD